MKYVMLAAVATIGAIALSTIAGAFLWAITEELKDIRDLLRIVLADAIKILVDDSPSAVTPPMFNDLAALTSEGGPGQA